MYTIQPGIINRQICKQYKKKNRPIYFYHHCHLHHCHLHHLDDLNDESDGYLADTEDYEILSQNDIVRLTISNLKL